MLRGECNCKCDEQCGLARLLRIIKGGRKPRGYIKKSSTRTLRRCISEEQEQVQCVEARRLGSNKERKQKSNQQSV